MHPSFDDIFSPLAESDWNFEAVPDGEMIACCLWEYARESRSIGMAAASYWCNVRDMLNAEQYKEEPQTKAAHDEYAESVQRRLKAFSFDADKFAEKFWESDLAAVAIYQTLNEYVRDDACGWQKLPLATREKFTKQVSQSFLFSPIAPAMVGDLEKLWKANSRDLEEIRSKPRSTDDDSEECACYQVSEPTTSQEEAGKSADGIRVMAFSVDFARFTDREMHEAFQQWLIANRPKKWKRPLRIFPTSGARGRKLIEFRVALERLGLMRLLHWHPPSQIRDFWPAAWRQYRRKQDSFRREVHQAARVFRDLFPFLPPDEKPSSFERYSVWMKSMDEAVARADRELKKA